MNYVIESRIHPPSDLIARLYTKDSPGGTVGGGIPIRRSSVEIISSFYFFVEKSGIFFKTSVATLNIMSTHIQIFMDKNLECIILREGT